MANEIGTPTLESAPLSNAFYKGDSAYEIAVQHGFTGTEEEWLALMHPLIVQATKQAKAEGDTSAAETYVVDHTAKEIYDAASAGRIVKLYVPQSSESKAGGAYYQLSSYSYNSKLDKYTLLFAKPGSAIYENDAGKTGYKDGDGTAYLSGVQLHYIEGMLMAPDGTALVSHDWSAYDTVPALDLVKTNIRAELAAETTRAKSAEKTNADAITSVSAGLPLVITGKYNNSVSPKTVTLNNVTVKDIYDAAKSGRQVILNCTRYGSDSKRWYLDLATQLAGYFIVFNGKCSFLMSDGHAEEESTTLYEYYDSTVNSTASGDDAHAEGLYTTASGAQSHAEGSGTTASGMQSHAEGLYTTASGMQSHAEGAYTTAASSTQHVSGRWNIADTSNTYAEIIGNGTGINARSNARTLDWLGNEWVAGKLTMGADPTADMDAVPLKRFNALAARVAAETTRAQAAEKSNADVISGEITRAKAAEEANADAITVVSNSLSAETTRAEKAEQANAAAITAETARAEKAEKVNADAITALSSSLGAETTRAKAAEKVNADAIATEVTRAKAAEKANTDAISAETARAESAEKANAAAAAEALNKANEAMEIYDSDNDVKYTYTIYAQQGIPHMALTKVTT